MIEFRAIYTEKSLTLFREIYCVKIKNTEAQNRNLFKFYASAVIYNDNTHDYIFKIPRFFAFPNHRLLLLRFTPNFLLEIYQFLNLRKLRSK